MLLVSQSNSLVLGNNVNVGIGNRSNEMLNVGQIAAKTSKS